MQCPYCGGWHGAGPDVPSPTFPSDAGATYDEARIAMNGLDRAARLDPYDRDTLPSGDGKLWDARVYATDEDGRELTIATGGVGTSREGHVLAAEGFDPSWRFYRHEEHDHFGPDFETERDKA
ncbi:MAG TPA: hypothetical protein VK978_02710 [Candidatus Saccharimonadales bacterium]|nr:hypothetical protein [Candidatus Saccharimonadales bacterium]